MERLSDTGVFHGVASHVLVRMAVMDPLGHGCEEVLVTHRSVH
jgi:hypothetical protein